MFATSHSVSPHPFGTIIGGFPSAARIVLIVGINCRSSRSNSSLVMTGSDMLGAGFALGRGGEYRGVFIGSFV